MTAKERIVEIARRRDVPVPGCAGLTQDELDRNMAQAQADEAADTDPDESDALDHDDYGDD